MISFFVLFLFLAVCFEAGYCATLRNHEYEYDWLVSALCVICACAFFFAAISVILRRVVFWIIPVIFPPVLFIPLHIHRKRIKKAAPAEFSGKKEKLVESLGNSELFNRFETFVKVSRCQICRINLCDFAQGPLVEVLVYPPGDRDDMIIMPGDNVTPVFFFENPENPWTPEQRNILHGLICDLMTTQLDFVCDPLCPTVWRPRENANT